MKMSSFNKTSLSLIVCSIWLGAGCVVFERADKDIGEVTGDGDDSGSGGSGLGGERNVSEGTGGREDLFGGGCPVEPCATGGSGPSGENLIPNGDFSQGLAEGWEPGHNILLMDERGCQTVTGDPKYIGWGTISTNLDLDAGEYTFSYSLSIEDGEPVLKPIVGLVEDPYTPSTNFAEATAADGPATHQFTLTEAKPSQGVVFIVSGTGTLCVDDVSLVKN